MYQLVTPITRQYDNGPSSSTGKNSGPWISVRCGRRRGRRGRRGRRRSRRAADSGLLLAAARPPNEPNYCGPDGRGDTGFGGDPTRIFHDSADRIGHVISFVFEHQLPKNPLVESMLSFTILMPQITVFLAMIVKNGLMIVKNGPKIGQNTP